MKEPNRAPRQNPNPERLAARAQRRRLAVLVLLGCLALLICALVWVLSLDRGPTAPAELELGTLAAAWAKNENGFYFNDAGAPILEAVEKGIDVSRYQGAVDWQKAKTAGIDFALLRCGFGGEWTDDNPTYNQDDVQWRHNADACTALGIPFGAYLYSYATTEEEARSEADHAARLLGLTAPPRKGLEDYTATPYHLSLPFYYDLEDASISGLFPDEMARLTAAFFDQLESYGYDGEQGIYASLNWVRGRLQDPGFDRWRPHFWIARFAPELGYSGEYELWQSTYTEPGAAYGVESETVDVDFRMQPLRLLGLGDTRADTAPVFTNDTRTVQLCLAAKGDRAVLQTDEPAEKEGGQRLFWTSSDETVATVDRHGQVRARGEGSCTVTVTRADGRLQAACTVRVGAVTVPVLVTGALAGRTGEGDVTLADVAALKAAHPDAILLDAGGSLQGTPRGSLTGGMDLTSAFSSADYDLQAVGYDDLAYGSSRLLADAAVAAGPTLAADLRGETDEALFFRSTSWNRNRITNGQNYIVERAGHRIGFFALAGAADGRYALVNEAMPAAADLQQTAAEQVAALRAAGAQAIVCILAPPFREVPQALAELGVTAVIGGGESVNGPLPALAGDSGWEQVGWLALTFAPDGSVTAEVDAVTAEELAAARDTLEEAAQARYDAVARSLQSMDEEDELLKEQVLFTLAEPEARSVSWEQYVAQVYEEIAENDRPNWDADGALTLYALAGAGPAPEPGEVTRGALLAALPAGARLQLVRTTREACDALLESGTVSTTWLRSTIAADTLTGPQDEVALAADTAALQRLEEAGFTCEVLRDYGDAFWLIRQNINDNTQNFNQPLQLPAAPELGAGRNS